MTSNFSNKPALGVHRPDADTLLPGRRQLLQAGLGLAGLPLLESGAFAQDAANANTTASTAGGSAVSARLGFKSVAPSLADTVQVPPGYVAQVLLRWGDPVGYASGQPAFKADGSNTSAEQALQAGMHHDGMRFFPINGSNEHGLLALNHEYTDEALLHVNGGREWGPEQLQKSLQAVGVSVVEVRRTGREWQVVRPSRYARRVTLTTPCRIAGDAAGHALMKTAQDPLGTTVLGTMMNCANGWTPWGTYLTCEENFHAYFGASKPGETSASEKTRQDRYGVGKQALPHYRLDPRFDVTQNPNEANRFGWVVEIDPFDPQSTPVKRTGMGRFKHEVAVPHIGTDGRIAFYMTDDEPFEYLYKFVTAKAPQPGGAAANRQMLDEGILYVARFAEAGVGAWLPLTHGTGPLTSANGFPDQATVLIEARRAADLLGATRMDRPEGCAVDPGTHDVFIACTNNTARGRSGAKEGANPANPRVNNFFGHVLRMREERDAAAATRFDWNFFLLAGDAKLDDALFKGNVKGDAFGSPDNLFLDTRGVLWIQTDVSGSAIGKVPYANLGNNQVLAADPLTGEVRRFMTVPRGAEATGCVLSPDCRTMFINIQHPGESQASNWPDGGKPRSATVVIQRQDGGVIGT